MDNRSIAVIDARQSTWNHLVCPSTGAPLRLQAGETSGDEAIDGRLTCDGAAYPIHAGIPSFVSGDVLESQTVRSFDQKWAKHDYYRRETSRFYTDWYLSRYAFNDETGLREFLEPKRFILDAGTGMGRDAASFAKLSKADVFAVDTSMDALKTARNDVDDPRVCFLHADINQLPVPDEFFDFISCDQVIHHTPDPRKTFESLGRKLQPGGHICCYVYRRKAAVREFTDDYVRRRISKLNIDDALKLCEGITHLGHALADLKATVEIKEDIPVLGIKKGALDLQRFFHWNVMKCFWNDEFDFFTNNLINFDWFHPEFCFRFEPDEFRAWFADGWNIEAWNEQDAGLSCRARKI